jgi:hypothetical protein
MKLKEHVVYNTAHQRIYKARGSASSKRCLNCGQQAWHWAYDHEDADELYSPRGASYSLNVNHYIALCISCHKTMDLNYAKQAS